MPSVTLSRRLGKMLYRAAFPLYRSLYAVFKARADRSERRFLARHLNEGAVVVDAGANIGIYSRFLSQCVGSTGSVHSFEPSPENFAHLADAVVALPNVRANQSGLGIETGRQLLYVSDDLNVDHRVYPTEGEARRTVPVDIVALDDYFAVGTRVDLIKADIQGYELHALRGAKRVLTDNPQIMLLLEFWPYGLRAAGASALDLLKYLEEQSFAIFPVGDDPQQKVRYAETMDSDPKLYYNLIARRLRTG